MKKFRIIIALALMLALCVSATGTAFATEYTAVPGLSGILPGDTLALPSNTAWATLKAVWGVRVTFFDKDGTEVRSDLIRVTGEPITVPIPGAPEVDGFSFVEWTRTDSSEGSLTINDNDTITISGKGPFALSAVYESTYYGGGTYEPYEPKPINTPDPEEPAAEPEEPVEEPEELPDEETPLSELPEEPAAEPENPVEPEEPAEPSEETEDIEDPEVPLADVPETGDYAVVYGLLMSAVCISLGALMIRRKEN